MLRKTLAFRYLADEPKVFHALARRHSKDDADYDEWLDQFESYLAADREDARKSTLAAMVKHYQRDGKLAVQVWGRDCDMVESAHVEVIVATVQAYDDLCCAISEHAEGPFSVSIMDWAEVESFQGWSRDRALEAFEEGHPWAICA